MHSLRSAVRRVPLKHTTNKVNNTPKASFKCSNLGVTNNKTHVPSFDR